MVCRPLFHVLIFNYLVNPFLSEKHYGGGMCPSKQHTVVNASCAPYAVHASCTAYAICAICSCSALAVVSWHIVSPPLFNVHITNSGFSLIYRPELRRIN